MNTRKKLSINLVVLILIFPVFSLAAGLNNGASGGIDNPIAANSIQDFFNGIVSVFIELGTIISVLGIMYGGYLYATAQGDEEKLGKAYKTITWALVGTAVLLGARTIMAAISGTISSLGTN